MTRLIDRRSAIGAIAGTAAMLSRAATAAEGAAAAPPTIAERFGAYVAGTGFDALDAATLETAKAHLIDAIGCGIAAFGETPVRACREVALALPGGPATVIGTTQRTSPDLAAFANGVAVRYYDFNDVYVGREPGHPSDNITACLAIAEAEARGGRDLLLSTVLAYEIACRLMDAAELTRRGWDHPIYSLPASALAAGKLMAMPPGQLAQAVNLAISGHLALNQTRVQVLSDWKGIADANAARNGVFAALLARRGVTGPSSIFEGNAGLFKQVSGPFELDVDAFGGRGGRFRINDCGVKLYPAQGGTLTAIPAAAKVAAEVGDLGRIQAIEVATVNFTYMSAGKDPEKWKPETKETADHSLPYVVARAMLDRDITNDSYTPAAIRDPAVRALMAKITVKPDEALTAMTPKALPNRVTATLTDGRTVSHQVDALPGFIGMPMQRSDFEQKFKRNVARVWSEAHQREVLDYLWALERQDKLDRLFELLVVKS